MPPFPTARNHIYYPSLPFSLTSAKGISHWWHSGTVTHSCYLIFLPVSTIMYLFIFYFNAFSNTTMRLAHTVHCNIWICFNMNVQNQPVLQFYWKNLANLSCLCCGVFSGDADSVIGVIHHQQHYSSPKQCSHPNIQLSSWLSGEWIPPLRKVLLLFLSLHTFQSGDSKL